MEPGNRAIVEQILAGERAEEIAERLDCSERTVRRMRQRIKLRLQRLI
jgi:FixJ family two-component response regulator